MSSSTTTTRLATPSDRDEVAALCLEAFFDEAVITWVLPDPTTRPAQMRAMFDASLDNGIEAGAVLLAIADTGTPVAISFWIPRTPAPEPTEPRPRPEDEPVARRLAVIEDATEGGQPGAPHLYLSSMAVLPRHRGRGVGGAMIAAGMAKADALDLPVHLEASTPGSRRLYARYGFQDHGAPIRLPGQGPVLQPMWRERTAP